MSFAPRFHKQGVGEMRLKFRDGPSDVQHARACSCQACRRQQTRDDATSGHQHQVEIHRFPVAGYAVEKEGDAWVIYRIVNRVEEGDTRDEMTNGVEGQDPDAAVREQEEQVTVDRRARSLVAKINAANRRYWAKRNGAPR